MMKKDYKMKNNSKNMKINNEFLSNTINKYEGNKKLNKFYFT
jgi:hypothetical protein